MPPQAPNGQHANRTGHDGDRTGFGTPPAHRRHRLNSPSAHSDDNRALDRAADGADHFLDQAFTRVAEESVGGGQETDRESNAHYGA